MRKNLYRYKKRLIHPGLLVALVVVGCIVVGVGAGVYTSELISNHVTIDQPTPAVQPALQPVTVATLDDKQVEPVIATPDAVIPPVAHGLAPVISRLETKQPVVFLTIDDGGVRGKDYLAYMKKYDLKASLFLSDAFIASDPDYFKPFVAAGFVIENHTVSHNLRMVNEGLGYQQREICTMSDKLADYYGRRPVLFRPPGGSFTATTQQAAANCNMRAVVNWKAKVNGGAVQYQEGSKLQAGDIVLMHFREGFKSDIDAFVTAMKTAGLHAELLEDWL
ncbi:MAG: polysaccharide deacetylase family protein [Candidatus Saccharimonas sp.]